MLESDNPMAILQDYGSANIAAIELLRASVSPKKLELAVKLMSDADTIYIQGVRRAYPVAFYLWYALTQTNRNVVLLESHGGMESYPSLKISKNDILLTTTYSPYAPETSNLIQHFHDYKVPIIAISDKQHNDKGHLIDVCFEVTEGDVMGFRSLSCSMYLAQTLIVSLMCKNTQAEINNSI